MDVDKILRTGYFDTLKLTGTLNPVYESTGIDILANETFKESLEKGSESYKNGVAELSINLFGESSTNVSFTQLEHMRTDRESCGLKRIHTDSSIDRYIVAYAEILIIKSDYAIPFEIKSNGKSEGDFEKLAKTGDMLEILLAALDISNYVESHFKYTRNYINTAVVNKVYVLPIFRQSGISTWLHQNLADIINMFALVFPTGVVMSYGDFSNESNKLFNMNRDDYNRFLLKHYKGLGYDSIHKLSLSNSVNTRNILYKLFV